MARKYVLFDMDGVLLDSERGSFGHMARWLRQMGYDVPLEKLCGKVGKNSRTIAGELIREYCIPMDVETFLARRRQFGNYYADEPGLAPMDGLYEFMDALAARGVQMGVVSSTSADSVLFALNRLRILGRVQALVCGDMPEHSKPAPDPYLLAAKFLGARPEECVVVEDSPIGIQSGQSAGMKVIGYAGSELRQDTSLAEVTYPSFRACLLNLDTILED